MARGKHARSAASRRARDLAGTLAQLRAEIDAEQQALAEAAAEAAVCDQLSADLARALADRDRVTATETERLDGYREVLTAAIREERELLEHVDRHWQRVSGVVIDRLGGGVDGVEGLMRLLGMGGVVNNHRHLSGMPTSAVTRMQTLRGERTTMVHDDPDATATGALAGLLRTRRTRPLSDAGICLDPPTPYTALTAEQKAVFDTVDRFAQDLFDVTDATLTADAIHVWHPLPWLSPVLDGHHGATLGVTDHASDATPGTGPAAHDGGGSWPPPTAATPAATRHRLADSGDADTLLDAWHVPLAARESLTRLYGRRAAPWSPRPLMPRPGYAAVLQHLYTKAAVGCWSRATDDQSTDTGDLVGITQIRRWGRTAVALTAAAPYWLPAGQTRGFADSEPLPDDDIDDLLLPFPQVLLTFADPIQIGPTNPGVDLSRYDRALLELARGTGRQTLRDLLNSVGGDLAAFGAITLEQALAARGGLVEAVLFTADSLGRLTDDVAWCVAIPAGASGMLGRFVVPASLAGSAYPDQLRNLAAVVAWAGWHAPDEDTALPTSARSAELDEKLRSSAFRRDADRAGAGNVRVLDVKATAGSSPVSEPTGRHVAPHVRRGHWRRQRYGPGGGLVKRVRISPVVVNAHRGTLDARVYRLPSPR